jgi:hypothetical protein
MTSPDAPRPRRPWRPLAVAGLVLLLAAVAIPALAAGPVTAPAGDAAGAQPAQAEKSPAPGKGPKEKKVKVAKDPITLTGRVSATTDENGRREYRLASGGKTYILDGGPSWFYGDKHPLEAHVGKSVTIAGEAAAGSTEVDVDSVNGTAIREPGRPPWAGGWKVVGKAHPGWSQEKADRMAEKLELKKTKFGGCFPPGQCKQDDAEE